MPGNEIEITKYLVRNKGMFSLHHLNTVISVGAPSPEPAHYIELNNLSDIERNLAPEEAGKKADIYINGHGVSLKQSGANFSYNRLQRANLIDVFNSLNLSNSNSILKRLDQEVEMFHTGQLDRRNRPWNSFFEESEFKKLIKFLMMEGSPNEGVSSHPAKFILEAPSINISADNINIYTFDEYFDKYKENFKIAIRRQWIGQASNSEHTRAVGLAKKPDNAPWVFNNVVGEPNMHRVTNRRWRADTPKGKRKTVYFLMLEKEA
jgi:hypothetical protein